jgi:hypothetical protein
MRFSVKAMAENPAKAKRAVGGAGFARQLAGILRECVPCLLPLLLAPKIAESISFEAPHGRVWLHLPYWGILAPALLPLLLYLLWLRRLGQRRWLRMAVLCIPLETYFALHLCQRVPWLAATLLAAAVIVALAHRAFSRSGDPPLEPRHRFFLAAVNGYAWVMLAPALLGAFLGPMGGKESPVREAIPVSVRDDGQYERLRQAVFALSPEAWEYLGAEERQQAFQEVLDAEAQHFSLEKLDFQELRNIGEYRGYSLRRAMRSRSGEFDARLRAACCAAYTVAMNEKYDEAKFSGKEIRDGARDYADGRAAGYRELLSGLKAREDLQTME